MKCENCGANIVWSPYAGEQWTHQPPGASGTDGMHVFCYISTAEPEEEMQPGQDINTNVEVPKPVSAPTPPEQSEVTFSGRARFEGHAQQNYRLLQQDHERLRRENEAMKTKYNDLARENEELKEFGPLTSDLLKRYCDNARAYGWEAGRLHYVEDTTSTITLKAVYNTSPNNPFVNPDWDKDLKADVLRALVTATETPL